MVWSGGNNYQQCLPVIQAATQAMEEYCDSLWIRINPSKTVLIPFGNKKLGLYSQFYCDMRRDSTGEP